MRWRGRRQSSNIEDVRGSGLRLSGRFGRGSGGPRMRRAGGGIGIVGLIVVVVIAMLLGINPLELLSGSGNFAPQPPRQQGAPRSSGDDQLRDFVATVLAESEDTWSELFAAGGSTYREPTLVLFSGSVGSACGFASAATGPFYCPGDKRVYIDLDFFEALKRRFSAPGDFAEAYVLAHEVGHHVQNLIGVLPKFTEMRRTMSESDANQMSVRVELQADCFAGIWARSVAARGLLEGGDIEEALNAASQIGDDMIQKRTQGYVVPESFNHGTSEQRRRWFGRGYQEGTLDACDTFNAQRV